MRALSLPLLTTKSYFLRNAEGDLAAVVLLGDEEEPGDGKRGLSCLAVGKPGAHRCLVQMRGGVGERKVRVIHGRPDIEPCPR